MRYVCSLTRNPHARNRESFRNPPAKARHLRRATGADCRRHAPDHLRHGSGQLCPEHRGRFATGASAGSEGGGSFHASASRTHRPALGRSDAAAGIGSAASGPTGAALPRQQAAGGLAAFTRSLVFPGQRRRGRQANFPRTAAPMSRFSTPPTIFAIEFSSPDAIPGISVLAHHLQSAGVELVLAHRNSSQSLKPAQGRLCAYRRHPLAR